MSALKIPKNRTELVQIFGKAAPEGSNWYLKNIVSQKVPYELLYNGKSVESVRFHYLAMPYLQAALTQVWNTARIAVKAEQKKISPLNYPNLTTEDFDKLTIEYLDRYGLREYDGTFQYRKIAGSDNLSFHSWGIAIDFAASRNGLGKTTTDLPKWFIKCFTDHGFFWGGNFKGRKDPMHFEYFQYP